MRDYEDEELKRFESGFSKAYVRLFIDENDFSDLDGLNWVKEVSWGEDEDANVQQMRAILTLSDGERSLSPFLSLSKLNDVKTAIGIHLTIKLQVALGSDQQPADSQFKTYFEGRIDDYAMDVKANTVTINARDFCGELQDLQLETTETYGAGSAESVMQDIIDQGWLDAFGVDAVPPTLQTPNGSPGFTVSSYSQTTTSILDACQDIATIFGWEIRMVPNDDQDGFDLALLEPRRAQVGIDYTMNPGVAGFTIAKAGLSKRDVRNKISVYLDGSPPTLLDEDEDADSITLYGPRYMQVLESSGSQMDTAGEATDFIAAALPDLKDPEFMVKASSHLFLHAEVRDYHTITADDLHFDTDQTLAITGFRHKINRSGHSTEFNYSGKPAAGRRRYLLRREALSDIQ